MGGIGRVPDGIPWTVAATVCCTAGTAVHVVRTRGRVQPGETVVITGASGGVGLQAVQLARLDGARVIAVTSGAGKARALYEAGADEVVVAPDLEFAPQVRQLTGGDGAQVGGAVPRPDLTAGHVCHPPAGMPRPAARTRCWGQTDEP